MQQDRSYQTDSRPDNRIGFVVVDPATIRRACETYRAETRTRCFHCGRPLTGATCPPCDRP